MTSFQAIAGSKSTNLAVVAPGIAEALLATAIGLVAAIPAVIAYNKFSADAGKLSGTHGRLCGRILRHPFAPDRREAAAAPGRTVTDGVHDDGYGCWRQQRRRRWPSPPW